MATELTTAIIKLAKGWNGYLEKRSNASLDYLSKNAGYNNYTNFARDYNTWMDCNLQANPWCAMFVSWLFVKCAGLSGAKKLLCGTLFASVPSCYNAFKLKGQIYNNPKVGDLIFFGDCDHIGIVRAISADKKTVYTWEGNTSSAQGMIDNGGAVAAKSYSTSYWMIKGYGRPDWSLVTKVASTKNTLPKTTTSSPKLAEYIKKYQKWLNSNYNAGLDVDGEYGPLTRAAGVKAFQKVVGVQIDGDFGPRTAAAAGRNIIKKGSKGKLVYLLQGQLFCQGYNSTGFDGGWGNGTQAAFVEFQKENGLEVDGFCGKYSWTELFS